MKMSLNKSFIILSALFLLEIYFISAATFRAEQGEIIFLEDYASSEFAHYSGFYKVCEEDRKAIPFLISNLENIRREYLIDFAGEKWANIPKKVSAGSKQSNMIFLSIQPPKDSQGTYVLKADFNNPNAGTKIRKEIPVLVEKCYAFEVYFSEQDLCGGKNYRNTVNIINKGNKDVTANASLDSLPWMKLNNAFFDIAANENKSVVIQGEVPDNFSFSAEIGLRLNIPKTNFVQEQIFEFNPDNNKCTREVIEGNESYILNESKKPAIKSKEDKTIFNQDIVLSFESRLEQAGDFFNAYNYYFAAGFALGAVIIAVIFYYSKKNRA